VADFYKGWNTRCCRLWTLWKPACAGLHPTGCCEETPGSKNAPKRVRTYSPKGKPPLNRGGLPGPAVKKRRLRLCPHPKRGRPRPGPIYPAYGGNLWKLSEEMVPTPPKRGANTFLGGHRAIFGIRRWSRKILWAQFLVSGNSCSRAKANCGKKNRPGGRQTVLPLIDPGDFAQIPHWKNWARVAPKKAESQIRGLKSRLKRLTPGVKIPGFFLTRLCSKRGTRGQARDIKPWRGGGVFPTPFGRCGKAGPLFAPNPGVIPTPGLPLGEKKCPFPAPEKIFPRIVSGFLIPWEISPFKGGCRVVSAPGKLERKGV